MCNGCHGYFISHIPGEMPDWMSYRGEGCSLSFHIPPVFQGLVVWFVCPNQHYPFETRIIIIIRNKSNGIQLVKETHGAVAGGWIRYKSRSEMAMEDYCADDELELYISSEPTECEDDECEDDECEDDECEDDELHIIKECGVHVIAGKLDSFEESAGGRDTVMPSSPSYHLLPHPHCGSIIASTPLQWSDYLFVKLHKYSFNLRFHGKKKYFI